MEQGPLLTNQWSIPPAIVMEGKYCRLEPLSTAHFDDLYNVRNVPDGNQRYQYLFSAPPLDRAEFEMFAMNQITRKDWVTFAVIDKHTGKAEGVQSYLNIVPMYGTVEIGGIMWGPNISRTRVTTEAFYLQSCQAMDDLKYRRYEWKCNNANQASRKAALRFGFQFEGVFRQHLIQNGFNRDTAYFSMLDSEWPVVKSALQQWLEPDNFDADQTPFFFLSCYRRFYNNRNSLNRISQASVRL